MNDLYGFLNQNSGVLLTLSTISLTLITAIYVYFTYKLVKETRILRESETECYLIVSPEFGNRVNSIDIVIRNVGNGAAYDISCQIGEQAHSIRYIAPGKKLRIEDWDEQNHVEVNVSYSDFKKRTRKDSITLDIEDFKTKKQSDVVAYDPLDEIDETLRRIAWSLPDRHDTSQYQKAFLEGLRQIEQQLRDLGNTIRNRLR